MTLQSLPTELKFRIFQFLSLQDLIRISLVCKEFKVLADTDSLWKAFYLHFQNRIVDSSVVGAKEDHKNKENATFPQTHKSWKLLVKENRLEKHWRSGQCRLINQLRDRVNCIDYTNSFLLAGCDDGAVRIWNLKTNTLKHCLRQHRLSVTCIQYDPNFNLFVTGSLDSTVRVWRGSSGEVTTLPHHHNGVRTLHFVSNLLATGSDDKSVVCVDLATGKTIDRVSCDSEVTHIRLHNTSQLLGVTTKYDVMLIDLREGSMKMRPIVSFRPFSHSVQISGFDFSDHLLLCGGYEKKLLVFDWRKLLPSSSDHSTHILSRFVFDESNWSNVLLKEIKGPGLVNPGPIRTYKNKIFFGCQFTNEMQIWDASTFQCIRRISSLTSPVKSFNIEDNQLITASYDGIIRVWKIRPLISLVDYC